MLSKTAIAGPYFSSLPLGNFPGVIVKIPEYDLARRKKYTFPRADHFDKRNYHRPVGKHDKQIKQRSSARRLPSLVILVVWLARLRPILKSAKEADMVGILLVPRKGERENIHMQSTMDSAFAS